MLLYGIQPDAGLALTITPCLDRTLGSVDRTTGIAAAVAYSGHRKILHLVDYQRRILVNLI
jgi:hypothetical protein